MSEPAFHVEHLKAKDYYGRPTPGWVVLVNGRPTHFAGLGARQVSLEYARRAEARNVAV